MGDLAKRGGRVAALSFMQLRRWPGIVGLAIILGAILVSDAKATGLP